MRLLLISLICLSSASAWAKFSPCDVLLDPEETELALILDWMAEHKLDPATPELMDEIDRLNMKALEIVSAKLTEIGVKHKIIYVDRFREPGFYSGQDMRYLEQRRDSLLASVSQTQALSVQARTNFERSELESRFYRDMQELKDIEARMSVPPKPLQSVNALTLAFAKPFIVLQPDDSRPDLLNELRVRFPNVEMIISVQLKTHTPGSIAGVTGLTLFQSPEQVFAPNFGNQLWIAHEMVHLEHFQALREGDIELPYNITVHAREGQTLPEMRKGSYDLFFDIGELDAWSRDLVALTNMHDDDFIPMRNHSDGNVYLQSGRLDVIGHKVTQMVDFVRGSRSIVSAIMGALESRPEEFQFFYDHPAFSYVTVPWRNASGEIIADIHISLKGLTRETEGNHLDWVSRYLGKVGNQIEAHKENLRALILKLDHKPGPHWTRVN